MVWCYVLRGAEPQFLGFLIRLFLLPATRTQPGTVVDALLARRIRH
jgi:hypothetical protein